ncbi:protease inhibitor Inh/omp19 family protein [Rhizobiaceae bacterium BDR2-2]|uniref:Outer membrane lipoprotein omp19 n=1 Tax=Ectorhizobium quercum TaxID=2965071 RepID=A0AAE3N4S2_9HYPH|nr:protease inhibitor Inh/omp19 family protein [Ectorhizobium quercum]MCX8999240.1 protease inhibitor Inh/omp19 family protein [Ectorhizobium quercum]
MQLRYVATMAAIVLSLAGCQRTSGGFASSPSTLPPLQAQPVGGVQSGALPPPASPQGQPGQFPDAPQQTASLPPGGAGAPPATAMDVRKEGMVGSWRVSNGGANCDMFLTLTNLGSGSRGGTRGCSGPLSLMGSWDVAGRQVNLKDRNGNVIGTLYKTSDSRYDGSLNDGQSVSLSR